jgi:hypothetical protein
MSERILILIDRLPKKFSYFFLKVQLKISLNPKFQNFRVDFKFSPGESCLGEKEKILREFLGEPITHKVTDQNVNRKT